MRKMGDLFNINKWRGWKFMVQFKTKIAEEISNAININKEELEGYIEMPKDSKNGDYAFPCFQFGKRAKKSSTNDCKWNKRKN